MKRGPSWQFVLSEDEQIALLETCADLTERYLIQAPLFLGLRIGELQHLSRPWVNSEESTITVPSRQSCPCGDCMDRETPGIWEPKSKAGQRTIYIAPVAARTVYEFLSTSPEGIGIRRLAIYQRIKGICRRASIRRPGLYKGTIYPHVLRATCATRLAEADMQAAALAYTMGWAKLDTAQHYIDKIASRKSALRKMREMFG